MMMLVQSIFIVVLGLVIGSFLNVVIYRLPRGESLWNPPSHCPQCNKPVQWYDNIPVMSFLLLGGRCRNCKKPISWRYPLVEGLCASCFLLTFWRYYPITLDSPSLITTIKDVLLISILIPVFFIDLEHQIIPDSLSYTLVISGLILSGIQGYLVLSLAGAGIGVGLFCLIFSLSFLFLRQPGMGIGDIKIAAGIGAFLGWKMGLLSFFLSFLIGAVVAGGFLLFRLKGMKDKIPFGPFLALGTLLTLFLGEWLIAIYLRLLW